MSLPQKGKSNQEDERLGRSTKIVVGRILAGEMDENRSRLDFDCFVDKITDFP